MAVDSDYLMSAIDLQYRKKLIKKFTRILKGKKIKDTFDTIVFKGVSGALIAPILSYNLNKEMIIVRHEKGVSHSSRKIEGNVDVKNYIIIDDLCYTGNTINDIIDKVRGWNYVYEEPKCVGLFLYCNFNCNQVPQHIKEQINGPIYYGDGFIKMEKTNV